MGAFIKGSSILLGLMIIANIIGMITSCAKPVDVPTFERQVIEQESEPCEAWSPIVQMWEDGSALRLDGCGIDAETREVRPMADYTVFDVPGGTWTVTPDTGARECRDGTTGECTGTEFLPGGSGR